MAFFTFYLNRHNNFKIFAYLLISNRLIIYYMHRHYGYLLDVLVDILFPLILLDIWADRNNSLETLSSFNVST